MNYIPADPSGTHQGLEKLKAAAQRFGAESQAAQARHGQAARPQEEPLELPNII
jgi:hypothetical protein